MKEVPNNQKLIKVRVYKDFEFPSFSINQDNSLEDLYHKSLEEVEDNFQEEGYFQIEIIQTLPFTLKKDQEHQKTMGHNFGFFIREIALADLAAKYGEINYERNPEIFDRRTRNNGEGAVEDSPYNLKEEVEQFYSDRVSYYLKALENKAYDRRDNNNRRNDDGRQQLGGIIGRRPRVEL